MVAFMKSALAFSALACFSAGVLAADCSGDKGMNPWLQWAWDIRQAVCGDGSCTPQFEDSGKGNCNQKMPIGGGWEVSFDASDNSGNYKTCWDATEQIIDQCWRKSGAYAESARTSSGKWALGDEQYTLTISYDDAVANYQPGEYSLDGVIGDAPPSNAEPSKPPPSDPIPTTTSNTTPTPSSDPNCPEVQPCPAGKSCPNPKPCDQLNCNTDCCGVVPNPGWCNANCGGMHC